MEKKNEAPGGKERHAAPQWGRHALGIWQGVGSEKPGGAPAGGVVGVEVDVQMVGDAGWDAVKRQLEEVMPGAIGVQVDLFFGHVRGVETVAGACLDPFPYVGGMLLHPLMEEVVRTHIAAIHAARADIPVEGTTGIVGGMPVVHFVFIACRLLLHPLLAPREKTEMERPQGVVEVVSAQHVDAGVVLAEVGEDMEAASKAVVYKRVVVFCHILLDGSVPLGEFTHLPQREQATVQVSGLVLR